MHFGHIINSGISHTSELGKKMKKNYLKNQGSHHDGTNIAININSMTPDFLQ